MKTAKSLRLQLHAEGQHVDMNTSVMWKIRIEIRFWQTVTHLMQHSRVVQWLVRSTYAVLDGKPILWVLGIAAVLSFIAFVVGFITGLVYPQFAAF
jgi:hypothetical protein